MDSCGFLLFGLLTLGWLGCNIYLAALLVKRSPVRWRVSGLWLGGAVMLAVFGRFLYQVHWLDEKLFIASASGNMAQVKALLSAGASPYAHWEDGTSALSAARSNGHKDIVTILEEAGAEK